MHSFWPSHGLAGAGAGVRKAVENLRKTCPCAQREQLYTQPSTSYEHGRRSVVLLFYHKPPGGYCERCKWSPAARSLEGWP